LVLVVRAAVLGEARADLLDGRILGLIRIAQAHHAPVPRGDADRPLAREAKGARGRVRAARLPVIERAPLVAEQEEPRDVARLCDAESSVLGGVAIRLALRR